MFCPNCGAELKEGTKFCPNCGSEIKQQVKVQAAKTEKVEPAKPAEQPKPAAAAPKSYNEELFLGPLTVFKKINFPVGLVAFILSIIAMMLLSISWMCGDAFSSSSGTAQVLLNVSRIVSIISWVLILMMTLLWIVHTVFQCIRLRSPWLKNELPGAIINGVVSILLFIFIIMLGQGIFNYHHYVYFGDKIASWWGVVTTLVMFVTFYCVKFKEVDDNHNLWMLKVIAITILFSLIPIMINAILACVGGFNGHPYSSEMHMWVSSLISQKFIVGIMGILFAVSLLSIPSLILGLDEEKAIRIVLWSIFAGVTFTFFLMLAIMLKSGGFAWFDLTEGEPGIFFYYNAPIVTGITIACSFWFIPCGIILNTSAKNILSDAA